MLNIYLITFLCSFFLGPAGWGYVSSKEQLSQRNWCFHIHQKQEYLKFEQSKIKQKGPFWFK